MSDLIEEAAHCMWSMMDHMWGLGGLQSNADTCESVFGPSWREWVAWGSRDPYYINKTREYGALMDSPQCVTFLIKKSLQNFSQSTLPTEDTPESKRLRRLASILEKELCFGNKDLISVLLREGWGIRIVQPHGLSFQHWFLVDKKITPEMATAPSPEEHPGFFHEAGVLPPSEERKEIIRKIRARTLSRASQSDPASIAEAISSIVAVQNNTMADPSENTNSIEEGSTLGDGKEIKVPLEDDSWMLPDPSELTSSAQKSNKKKPLKRKKTKPATDLPDHSKENTDTDTNTRVIKDSISTMDPKQEEADDNEGEWSTVINSKPRKQEGAQKKDTMRLSGAWVSQKTESSKNSNLKSVENLVESNDSTMEEFHLKVEEFPDLSTQKLAPRKKSSIPTATSTSMSQLAQTSKTKATYDIMTKALSQKEFKQKAKASQKINEGQSAPGATVAALRTAELPTTKAEETATRSLRITSSSSDSAVNNELSTTELTSAAPYDKRSVSASSNIPPISWSAIVSAGKTSILTNAPNESHLSVTGPQNQVAINKETKILQGLDTIKATHSNSLSSSHLTPITTISSSLVAKVPVLADIQNISQTSATDVGDSGIPANSHASTKTQPTTTIETINDNESLASEKTIVPEIDEGLSSKSEHALNRDLIKDLSLAAAPASKALEKEKVDHFNEDIPNAMSETPFASFFNEGNYLTEKRPESLQQKQPVSNFVSQSDEGTVYANSLMDTNPIVPHPLAEFTEKVNSSFESNPGKITVNGTDAAEILGHRLPPPLRFHDHPDVNLFLHSDWVTCAFCDRLIREANGEPALICSRCGPCCLTRYCSKACLLNDLKEHWEKCSGESLGVFPLDWTSLPNHYFEQLPALGTWSDSYTPYHSRERQRQITYIANLLDNTVPDLRKSYFDKVIKSGPSETEQSVRLYKMHDKSWNQAQAYGDYFIFIDYEHIQNQAAFERDGTGSGTYEHAVMMLRRYHQYTEGLCPNTAIPIHLDSIYRVAFSRLINACFVANNSVLVEFLWRWIRSEISSNGELFRYCRRFGIDQSLIFTLWAHQFEREFGVSEASQLAMLDREIQSGQLFHPYSDIGPNTWAKTVSETSIHSLVYEHELYHPLLRAWRVSEPDDATLPKNPWARFRGDGFLEMKRPWGAVIPVNKPQNLIWHNGWHGMPQVAWKSWLRDRHIMNVRLALEEHRAWEERRIAESRPKTNKFGNNKAFNNKFSSNKSSNNSWYTHKNTGKVTIPKWEVLLDGGDMIPMREMELRLQTNALEIEVKHNPVGSGMVYIRKNSFTGSTSPTKVSEARTTTTLTSTTSKQNISVRSQLNPAVPEFRTTSPEKHHVQAALINDEEDNMMPPKNLASNAEAWLNYTRNPILSTHRVNASANQIDDELFARWISANAAWIELVNQEKSKAVAREKAELELQVKFEVAMQDLKLKHSEEHQKNSTEIGVARAKAEGLELEIKEKGSTDLREKVEAHKNRDVMVHGGSTVPALAVVSGTKAPSALKDTPAKASWADVVTNKVKTSASVSASAKPHAEASSARTPAKWTKSVAPAKSGSTLNKSGPSAATSTKEASTSTSAATQQKSPTKKSKNYKGGKKN